MLRVLLTGASGFIGSNFLRECNEVIDIIPAYRTEKQKEFNGTSSIKFIPEISGDTKWELTRGSVDVVIHCAGITNTSKADENVREAVESINVQGTRNLAEQAAFAGAKRFIFLSSVKVLGESNSDAAPFRYDSFEDPKDLYARSKQQAEIALKDICKSTGMEYVIIRPPLVYGPGAKSNINSLFRVLDLGIPLPLSGIKRNRRSLVSVSNLADLILKCATHPEAANQTFLVSDGNDVSTSELIDLMARALNKRNKSFAVPPKMLLIIGVLLRKKNQVERLTGNLSVDIKYTQDVLGWSPRSSMEDELKKTVFKFRKRLGS